MAIAAAAAPAAGRARRLAEGRPDAIGRAIALLALAWGSPAAAQFGASAALHSDYRYRSYSLSLERPAAALNLSYDHGAGLYAGGSLIAADTARRGWRPVLQLAYAGLARRPERGPTWDVGVSTLRVKYYDLPLRTVRYEEVYAGVVGEHASLRLAYAPDYFQTGRKTLYVDLGLAYRPAPDWRVFGHAGLLHPVGGRYSPGARRERYDLSAGVARRIGRAEILLQATTAGPGRARGLDKDGLALTANWNF